MMKNEHPAKEPRVRPYPITCRTSDLDYDFGAPLLSERQGLRDRWHAREVEQEHGLRADVYRALGLM